MIDDTKGKQPRPVLSVSFTDLEALGFQIFTQVFEKEKPDKTIQQAVKIVKVEKDGKVFPRHMMMEFLRVFGLETEERVWVRPKKVHRCLSQKEPTVNFAYQAYERLDKTWLQSGRASTAAILFSSNMKDMSEVAENMRNGGDS